jgi:hypothetical protein
MNLTILKKVCLLSVFCVAMVSLAFYVPMTCYGQETCPMDVEVSPYQVNIDSGGVEHYVRVLTYTWYSNTDTDKTFVYINDNEDPIDSNYIKLTRDSVGHLVVKIDLIALQEAGLEVDTFHNLKIAVTLKVSTDDCVEKEGVGEIYIVGKKGK